MKILQINTTYKNGGSTGRIVHDLKSIMDEMGISNNVAFGYEYIPTNDSNTLKIQSIPYLKYNILKTRLFARHGFYNKRSTKRLLKYIDEISPDVIHLHNIHNSYVNIEMLFEYIKLKNISIVWTLHDCWSFTGWCAYFDYVKCEKWKSKCHSCPCKHDYPFTWFFDKSSQNYEDKKRIFTGVKKMMLITPSSWLANLVNKSFLKEYPVQIINNGIDTFIFKPTESDVRLRYGIGKRKMILAMAMHLDKRKGIDYLIEMRNKLSDNECLVLVGVTSKEKKELATEKCITIEQTSNVEDLVALYSSADVFINPTLEDNFPTTNLEALACGTPIVTFNTGGSIESIDDNVGIVVEKGNLEEFLFAIRMILKKEKWSEDCVKKAKLFYDKKKQFKKYIDLYNDLSINYDKQ